MVNAQEWLDKEYPDIEKRKKLKKLDVSKRDIKGTIDLRDFVELEELDCSKNKLTSLNLDGIKQLARLNCSENQLIDELNCKNLIRLREINCADNKLTNLNLSECCRLEKLNCSLNKLKSLNLDGNLELTNLDCSANEIIDLQLSNYANLKELWCSENQLTSVDFLTKLECPNGLESLDLSNNDFSSNNLEFLRPFVNLEEILLGTDDEERIKQNTYNRFYGSLEPLKNVSRLSELDISATDIDSGSWCLALKLQPSDFICSSKRENARCLNIEKPVGYLGAWDRRKRRKDLKKSIEKVSSKSGPEILSHQVLLDELSKVNSRIRKVPSIGEENLKKIITEKLNIPGMIQQIDIFETWFNPNCALVINKVVAYTVRLIIYKNDSRQTKEGLLVKKFPKNPIKWYSLEEAQEKTKRLKRKLNGDNPILAISKKASSVSSMIEKFSLPFNISPKECLKPLDIIWRKMLGTPNYHVAIYLGDKKVVQISFPNKKNSKVMIDSWEKFLKENKDDLIRHHPVIPFKKPEQIIEHIAKCLFLDYGEGEYNLLFQNCEHFATLCVCGVSFSEQADKLTSWFDIINLEKEINKNNEIFAKLKLDNILQEITEESKSEECQTQIQVSPKVIYNV